MMAYGRFENMVVAFFALAFACLEAAGEDDADKNQSPHPSNHGSAAFGDFQSRYTSNYAHQFQHFMSTGDHGHGGDVPPYTRGIVGEYAQSYEKHMNEPGSPAAASAKGAFGGNRTNRGGAGSKGVAAGQGDYQQHMNKYEGDLQKKVIASGAGTKSWSGRAVGVRDGDQQYMKQDADDYQKYVQSGGAGAAGGAGGAGGAAIGPDGYQQYAGDDQKHMNGGGASATGGAGVFGGARGVARAAARPGGYQQYMRRFAGDYQKYMNGGGAGATGRTGGAGGGAAGPGGYQQYMKQYAGDYQKYMSGAATQHGFTSPGAKQRNKTTVTRRNATAPMPAKQAHTKGRSATAAAAAATAPPAAMGMNLRAAVRSAAKDPGIQKRGAVPAVLAGALAAALMGYCWAIVVRRSFVVDAKMFAAGSCVGAETLEGEPYVALDP